MLSSSPMMKSSRIRPISEINSMLASSVTTPRPTLGPEERAAQDVAQDQGLLDRARQEGEDGGRDDADADRGEQVVAVHGRRGQGSIVAPARP